MAELTTLARPYAKAAFLFAREQNALDKWESMLGLAAALIEDATMAEALDSPALSVDEKANLFVQVGGDQFDAGFANLIAQLAQYKRLELLPTIFAQYHALMAEQQKFADVEVVSAFELDDAETGKLVESLKKRFGMEVRVSNTVDAGLIGGVIIRAGDTVIDGSVRGRLNKLAEHLNSRV